MTTDTATQPAAQASRRKSATEPVTWRPADVNAASPTAPHPPTWSTSSPPSPKQSIRHRQPTARTLVGMPPARSQFRVTGLRKWEGKILEVTGDTFTAELFPIDEDGMPITADFDLDLLGSDAANAEPGDVFYLAVRTVKAPGKRPEQTASLRLRRLGRVSAEEVQEVNDWAAAYLETVEQLFD